MSGAVLRAGRAVRSLVRQATGEARWDDYVARCRADGVEPMSRKAYERERADHREAHPESRCC